MGPNFFHGRIIRSQETFASLGAAPGPLANAVTGFWRVDMLIKLAVLDRAVHVDSGMREWTEVLN
jgi:hypothetical protein